MTGYNDFLATKTIVAAAAGRNVDPATLPPDLFGFQRDLVSWALRKGRAAIFADTGLGKTAMQLAWASLAADRALVLAPLAVAHQTIAEGAKFGVAVTYARRQDEAPAAGITITNYERLEAFDPAAFGAVVLDESSILKSFEGKTRSRLIETFADTPMRLACTATPAPNDISEIANHAEFLGVMSRPEMLAAFFVHEHDKGNQYRLKSHGREAFFRWLASWGMAVKRPGDLGYPDDGYDLPGLTIEPIFVETVYRPDGALFATELKGVTERARVRKATAAARVAAAVELVGREPDEPWIVWCGLNDEASAVAAAIPGAVNVEGAMAPEAKAEAMVAFSRGDVRVLVTKASIAGYGMNWQHCARMAFVGLSDSYEDYYQCLRRCYRFGQRREVRAFVVLSDLERAIHDNILRKEREAEATARELVKHVAEYERAEIGGRARASLVYEPRRAMTVPAWLKGA